MRALLLLSLLSLLAATAPARAQQEDASEDAEVALGAPEAEDAEAAPEGPGAEDAEAVARAPDASEGETPARQTEPSQIPEPSAEGELLLRLESGRLARRRGELQRALEDFRAAYELAPGPEQLLAVAEMLGALRRDGELRAAYGAFLRANPGHPRAGEIRARLAILDAAAVAPPPPPPEEDEPGDEPGEGATEGDREIFEEPWFWAVVVVAAAAGLLAIINATGGGGVEDPIPGSDGAVIGTLVEW